VYRVPGNFIDRYQRSYSASASAVASLAGSFITAQQRTGVAATAKHFPGLGAAATAQNTDERPVTLAVPLSALRATDERPYAAAIAAGVKLVMVSWAVYPALDPHRPAGLSKTVIVAELRRRLGFHGVTITDGLGAGALRAYGDFAGRGVLAAQAGADVLLCAGLLPQDDTPANGLAVLGAVRTAIARGTLGRTDARQAAARVIALRASL
jgi:beta-N-acetylhexosaminidase